MINREMIEAVMLIAYEAGKWAGQVELEESIERDSLGRSALESVFSHKNAMPSDRPSDGRTVIFNLRSQEWRDGVNASSQGRYKDAVDMLYSMVVDVN